MPGSKFLLPESLRESLKAPIGELIQDKEISRTVLLEKSLGAKEKILVSIGDRTTERLLQLSFAPDLEIVDAIEKRSNRPPIPFSGKKDNILQTRNPPGSITDESLGCLSRSLELLKSSKERVRIEVRGEEDLLVLPVVAFFPEDTIVTYGQPNEGMVVVKSSGRARSLCLDILGKMGIRAIGQG